MKWGAVLGGAALLFVGETYRVGTRRVVGWGMGIVTRATWVADVLVLVGLVLLGAALWLAWGWPAALAFAGTVLVAVGLVLVRAREVSA